MQQEICYHTPSRRNSASRMRNSIDVCASSSYAYAHWAEDLIIVQIFYWEEDFVDSFLILR